MTCESEEQEAPPGGQGWARGRGLKPTIFHLKTLVIGCAAKCHRTKEVCHTEGGLLFTRIVSADFPGGSVVLHNDRTERTTRDISPPGGQGIILIKYFIVKTTL